MSKSIRQLLASLLPLSLVLLAVVVNLETASEPSPATVRLAIAGDFGANDDTREVSSHR